MATGEYVCFVDDDDRVSPNYISSILKALESRPDGVGFVGEISYPMPVSGKMKRERFYHTLANRSYKKSPRGYERPLNHLNPMRRDIVSKYAFDAINMGEDTDWAMRICRDQVIGREVWINEVLYFYDYRPDKDY
jgi:glycosyltransferase involved in cell wall biosynthesis